MSPPFPPLMNGSIIVMADSILTRIYINMLVPDLTQSRPPYASPREVTVDAIHLFVSSRIRPAGQAHMAGPSRRAVGDYFYRSLYRLLGGGAICSPEFGIEGEPGGSAWWDIWLPQYKFAIVVATAGSCLREIEARFKPGGRYYGWVESGRCSMWAIVYFLFNSPQFNDVPFEGLVPLAVRIMGSTDGGWEALGLEGLVHVWFDTEYKRVAVRNPGLRKLEEFEIREG